MPLLNFSHKKGNELFVISSINRLYLIILKVKREHYRALAHYYVAVGLLDHEGGLL